jgi:hypothetical protein
LAIALSEGCSNFKTMAFIEELSIPKAMAKLEFFLMTT